MSLGLSRLLKVSWECLLTLTTGSRLQALSELHIANTRACGHRNGLTFSILKRVRCFNDERRFYLTGFDLLLSACQLRRWLHHVSVYIPQIEEVTKLKANDMFRDDTFTEPGILDSKHTPHEQAV